MLYLSLHQKVLLDLDEGQEDVFISVVGFLEVHLVIELVFDYAAGNSFSIYKILRCPLMFSHVFLEKGLSLH